MGESQDKLRKLLLLLITWALLLGFFLGYDTYFVATQKQFLVEREFRALASISRKIEAEFDRARLSVESAVKLAAPAQAGYTVDLKCGSRSIEECRREYFTLYLNEVLVPEESPAQFPGCAAKFDREGTDPRILLETSPEKRGLKLQVHCFAHTQGKTAEDPSAGGKQLAFVLDMSPWIRTAVASASNTFEDVLMVDTFGHTLLEQGTGGVEIHDLNSMIAASTDIGWKNPGWTLLGKSSSEGGGAGAGSNQTRKIDDLFERSAASRIVLGGKNYLLFSQPTQVILGSYPPGGTPFSFLVCGLRREGGLDAESRALPYGFLIWVGLAAIVLFSVSWPLFKLRYMGNTDRFSPRDGWYLILALFLMSTATAMMLLNASYIAQARQAADGKLKSLAGQMERNFRGEIKSAFTQLRDLRRDPSFAQSRMDARAPGLHGSYLTEPAAKQLTYPYFEIAFWADCRGHQVLKLDIRPAPTPSTDVSRFLFFKRAEAHILRAAARTAAAEHCPEVPESLDNVDEATKYLYFEPLMSPNTDEFAPALAAPFRASAVKSRRLWIQALALRPLSVVDPVLPPGYGFAVIDGQCGVLFHSESSRNLRENFCDESKNKTELRPWLFGGSDAFLDITYAGGSERAYLTNFPLPNLSSRGDAFLIVFEDPGRELTLNLAIILVASLLLAVYFLSWAAGAVVHLLLRSPLGLLHAPGFMWPQPRKAFAYIQVFAINLLMFAVYWFAARYLYEVLLLLFTLEVAIFSLGMAMARLAWPAPKLAKWGKVTFLAGSFVIAMVFLAGLFNLVLPRSWRFAVPPEWAILGIVPMLLGGIAVLITKSNSITEPMSWKGGARWSERIRRNFTAAYSLAAVGVIACAAVVPSVGSFKYAYDAVSEISLKHDQAVLAERVIARRDRIRSYYDGLEAPGFAACRLQQFLDLYYRSSFSLTEPTPLGSACPSLAADPVGSETQPSEASGCKDRPAETAHGWNETIEKWIARFTLRFPANELGSEMSRLGVASTSGDKGWERTWSEPNPRCFALVGADGSRISGFRIVSVYPAWSGLTCGSWVYLGLFMTGLLLWLISLVRQVFLTTVESAPPFPTVQWKAVSDIDTNYLVIGRTQSGKSKLLRSLSGLGPDNWRDLRVELAKMTEARCPRWQGPPLEGSVLILDHFEFNICDRTWNRARLELLETLLYKERSRLVLVSTVDPSYFLGEEAAKVLSDGKDPDQSARLFDRWVRALSKFTRVTLGHAGKDDFVSEVAKAAELGPKHAQFAAWICRECGSTSLLRTLGITILREMTVKPPLSRGQLTEIVLDRAKAYYRVVWSGLTASERLVLYQLALDGWANPKNAGAIQQLERKQLICKAPMYRVMNDSFCRFVLSGEHASEILEWGKREQESTWRAFRFVLLALLIGGGVWLLYAQAQLLQIGTGTITAIATLLTAVAGLSTRFKRSQPEVKTSVAEGEA